MNVGNKCPAPRPTGQGEDRQPQSLRLSRATRWHHLQFHLTDIDGEHCGTGEGAANAETPDGAWLALTFLLQRRYPELALALVVVGAVKVTNAQPGAAAWVRFAPPSLFGGGGA